ncbi:MAG TPA: histidine kinase [Chitinophagaceae bacterium]|nr:histidine kinase [Chitinophagaceae bacterium]
MKKFDWTTLFKWPRKVYTQVFFWLVVYALYVLLKEYPARMHGATLACLVLQELLELVIPCYSQNLLILPLLKRRKWIPGILVYLAQLVVLIELLPYVLNAVGWIFATVFHITDVVDWRQEHIAFSIVAFTVVATFTKAGLDRLIKDKEQKENELRHLRAQLNPHFLFNTLNNLYGLAVAESKKLPDLMLKLSGLLRYSLYETNRHYVPLAKEVDYICNFVELERIRLSNQVLIGLAVEGEMEGLFIAPLLMIIFVENAFKHFSAAKDGHAYIDITVSVKDNRLHLTVCNSVDPVHFAATNKSNSGLGLENVQQRLNLIYPGQYQCKINTMPGTFDVDLLIELI